MASPDDLRQPAATIAAALIARVDPSQEVSAEEAAEIYFQVLEAMRDSPSGDLGDPMPFSVG